MNPLIRPKKAAPVFFVVLVCFGLLSTAQAVSPPPDGGYAGGNTAEGQAALLSLTTGGFNSALGFLSLRSLTTGNFNTAVGAGTLLANTGTQNTATGAGALLSNTTRVQNTANGAFALFNNTTGSGNIALGTAAGLNLTVGNNNICIGNNGVPGESGIIRIGTDGTHTDTFLTGNVNVNGHLVLQGQIQVPGANIGTNKAVFIHRATANNIFGDYTTITHPMSDGDPNAILFVTQNYNPRGTGGAYNNHSIGVYYTGGHWTIFNEDLAAMPVNAAFNVMIVKP